MTGSSEKRSWLGAQSLSPTWVALVQDSDLREFGPADDSATSSCALPPNDSASIAFGPVYRTQQLVKLLRFARGFKVVGVLREGV